MSEIPHSHSKNWKGSRGQIGQLQKRQETSDKGVRPRRRGQHEQSGSLHKVNPERQECGKTCACEKHAAVCRLKCSHSVCRNMRETQSSQATSDVAATNVNTGTSSTVKELPGFYYDHNKKRYFRLVPGHNNFNPLTSEGIAKKETEQRRQELLNSNQPDSRKWSRSEISTGMSLCNLHRNLQLGQLTSRQFTRYAHEQAISKLDVRPSKLSNFPDRYFNGELGDISILQVDDYRRKVLMVISHNYLSRMWQGTIVCDPSKSRGLAVSNWKIVNVVGRRTSKITSASCFTLEPTGDLHVIYSMTGGPISVVQLLKFPLQERTADRTHIAYSYESNYETAWTCTWSHNPRFPSYLSIGLNGKAVVVDTEHAEKWKVHTNHSDVLAQVFSKESPILYNGNRYGEILGCDIRFLRGKRSDIKLRLQHKVAVCSIRLLKDENYLLASDMNGEIKLWDVRQCSCVHEYTGHCNHGARLPVDVDSTETVLCAVGQDAFTRLWRIQGGDILRTIPSPEPANNMGPAVVYSRQWHSGAPPGLLLGVKRSLYWYPL